MLQHLKQGSCGMNEDAHPHGCLPQQASGIFVLTTSAQDCYNSEWEDQPKRIQQNRSKYVQISRFRYSFWHLLTTARVHSWYLIPSILGLWDVKLHSHVGHTGPGQWKGVERCQKGPKHHTEVRSMDLLWAANSANGPILFKDLSMALLPRRVPTKVVFSKPWKVCFTKRSWHSSDLKRSTCNLMWPQNTFVILLVEVSVNVIYSAEFGGASWIEAWISILTILRTYPYP